MAGAARKILGKVRKDLKLKKRRRNGTNGVSRKAATVVLAQGALAVPRKNFGSKDQGKGKIASLVKCLDARIPKTLGLPRAVGPYTIIRTTALHKSSSNFILFSPVFDRSTDKWFDWCGIESVSGTDPVSGTDNSQSIQIPMAGILDASSVVPAAMTVQVMNPASLQTATGMFAMGRVNQQLDLGDSLATLSYNEMRARFISFYAPRLLTGGKLALRGVKTNSYPLDMSEYSTFAPIRTFPGMFTWNNDIRPAALAPIVFVNEPHASATPQELEFMVTIEWRVRFDPGNPATASHTHHNTLSDECWNDVVKAMSAAGHGVEEISEGVAEGGAVLGAASMLI